jgi:hypothetical protein
MYAGMCYLCQQDLGLHLHPSFLQQGREDKGSSASFHALTAAIVQHHHADRYGELCLEDVKIFDGRRLAQRKSIHRSLFASPS